MKHLVLIAITLSLCSAEEIAPQDQTPDPVEPQPVETAEAAANETLLKDAEPYLQVARQHIDLLRRIREALKGVVNTETANAAAAEVDMLALQVKKAMEQEQSLPEPSREVQYLVSAETATLDLEELTNESIGRAIELQEMETPGFGSGALEQALDALLSLYLQDEESGEEE